MFSSRLAIDLERVLDLVLDLDRLSLLLVPLSRDEEDSEEELELLFLPLPSLYLGILQCQLSTNNYQSEVN